MTEQPAGLEEMLERISQAACSQEQVSIRSVMKTVGARSFGPLVLTAGLILASPLSGIPGLPTVISAFVLLVAIQLLLNYDHFWLPEWLLNRSISSIRLLRALRALQTSARLVDKPLRPRLTALTYDGGSRIAAGACIMIAVCLPPLEIIPFTASIGGVALVAFGLSLITHDGVLALLAYVIVLFGLVLLGRVIF